MRTPRLIVAAAGATAMALALFSLMQWLVTTGERPAVVGTATAATLERIRIIAEPPPPPPPLVTRTTPQPPAAQPRTPTSALPAFAAPTTPLIAPELDLPLAVSGRPQTTGAPAGVAGVGALAAFARGEASFEGAELVPVASARPRYPRSAAQRGIEGWVELIFIVNGSGRVEQVRILDASPRGVFEDAAVQAMRNWVYAPYYRNGNPVAREATQLFRFRKEDIQDIYLWDD